MALTASRLQSIVALETKKEKLKYKINCFANKENQLFPDALHILFFPHGQCNENIALQTLFHSTKTGIQLKNIQTQKPYIGNNLHHVQFYQHMSKIPQPVLPSPTIQTIYSNTVKCFNKAIGSRPDALTDNYVVEVKCPFGGPRKRIPVQYIVQMFVEMHVANKKHALFVDYYNPKGWLSFVQYILHLYRHPPKAGQRVFRNDVDIRRNKTNLINKMIIHADIDNIEDTATFFRDKSLDNIELSDMIKFTKGDVPNARTLLHFLQQGTGLRGGTVIECYYDHIVVQWDRNKHVDHVASSRFRENLVHVLNNIEPLLRNIPGCWRAWIKALRMNHAIPLTTPKVPTYPEMLLYRIDWCPDTWSHIEKLIQHVDSFYQNKTPFKDLWQVLRACRKRCLEVPQHCIETKTF